VVYAILQETVICLTYGTTTGMEKNGHFHHCLKISHGKNHMIPQMDTTHILYPLTKNIVNVNKKIIYFINSVFTIKKDGCKKIFF